MKPSELQPEAFRLYPPEARMLAASHVPLLRGLPIAFLPLLLRELIEYDWRFPAERRDLERQFTYLAAEPEILRRFAALRISSELERIDWVNQPAQFAEQMTAELWASHQIDAFRSAAVEYVELLSKSAGPVELGMPRLVMAVVGQGIRANSFPLFRKLRPHGVYYSNVDQEGGKETLVEALRARSRRQPAAYGHWYIDGGEPWEVSGATVVSYAGLAGTRARLQSRIQKAFESGVGSEALRSLLARMRPGDAGMDETGAAVMNRFELSLLTEGSGTQIYSTTFVQWAAREALRRAQPVTLLARFAPRQAESAMPQMLKEARSAPPLDPEGSLVDADMGAYYTWLNQRRLPGWQNSRFLAWFEEGREAVVVGPGLAGGTVERGKVGLPGVLAKLGVA